MYAKRISNSDSSTTESNVKTQAMKAGPYTKRQQICMKELKTG